MEAFRGIQIDDASPLFNRTGMFYKEFVSDIRQIRYYSLLVVQKAPLAIKELNLLEQQISEIIKNAIKHGNNSDPSKIVKVWYQFNELEARIIVEDEGSGFQDIEAWNDFNRKRIKLLEKGEYDELVDYVCWRTKKSDDLDGGNALFAAVEYWNSGYVFTNKRNCVAAGKVFQTPQLPVRGA